MSVVRIQYTNEICGKYTLVNSSNMSSKSFEMTVNENIKLC